jgi:hypothetical protein
MNAKLQQLMDQSFTDHQGERFDPEKFAELIVKECINYCGENLSNTVGGSLKIHFGITK